MFAMAVDLDGRDVIVVGAGRLGAHKAEQLLEANARVTVIALEVLAPLPAGIASLVVRGYRPGDLAGAFLVVSATGDPLVNNLIVAEATDRGLLINVVDDPTRSNFYFTAVHRDGDVVVSVSTSGASPALAQWIRTTVANVLPTNLASVAARLRAERAVVHAQGKSTEGYPWAARVRAVIDDVETESSRNE